VLLFKKVHLVLTVSAVAIIALLRLALLLMPLVDFLATGRKCGACRPKTKVEAVRWELKKASEGFNLIRSVSVIIKITEEFIMIKNLAWSFFTLLKKYWSIIFALGLFFYQILYGIAQFISVESSKSAPILIFSLFTLGFSSAITNDRSLSNPSRYLLGERWRRYSTKSTTIG